MSQLPIGLFNPAASKASSPANPDAERFPGLLGGSEAGESDLFAGLFGEMFAALGGKGSAGLGGNGLPGAGLKAIEIGSKTRLVTTAEGAAASDAALLAFARQQGLDPEQVAALLDQTAPGAEGLAGTDLGWLASLGGIASAGARAEPAASIASGDPGQISGSALDPLAAASGRLAQSSAQMLGLRGQLAGGQGSAQASEHSHLSGRDLLALAGRASTHAGSAAGLLAAVTAPSGQSGQLGQSGQSGQSGLSSPSGLPGLSGSPGVGGGFNTLALTGSDLLSGPIRLSVLGAAGSTGSIGLAAGAPGAGPSDATGDASLETLSLDGYLEPTLATDRNERFDQMAARLRGAPGGSAGMAGGGSSAGGSAGGYAGGSGSGSGSGFGSGQASGWNLAAHAASMLAAASAAGSTAPGAPGAEAARLAVAEALTASTGGTAVAAGRAESAVAPGSQLTAASPGGAAASPTSAASADSLAGLSRERYEALAQRLGEALGQRIAGQIARGEWRLRIQLSPAHLGQIDVDLEMHRGELEATFRASQALTRDLLSESLPRLRQELERAGMDVAGMGVDSRDAGSGGGNSTPHQTAPAPVQALSGPNESGSVRPGDNKSGSSETSGLDILV